MKVIYPAAGTYIIAVSGGVDSVVLLDILARSRKQDTTIHHPPSTAHQFVVAHVDHCWRSDSQADARFVEALTAAYQLPYESTRLNLKIKSEAEARQHRWDFLERVRQHYQAVAVVTAHHRDDVIETMLMNLRRGTGRSGLTSLKESETIKRPLLHRAKAEIIEYATEQRLEFVQDSSNLDLRFLRNRIRRRLASQPEAKKTRLFDIYQAALETNRKIDAGLRRLMEEHCEVSSGQVEIEREWYARLPTSVQAELLRGAVLYVDQDAQLSKEQIDRGVAAITHAKTGKITELGGRMEIRHHRERSVVLQISTQRMKVLKYRDQKRGIYG